MNEQTSEHVWSYTSHTELASSLQESSFSKLNLVRLAPGDGQVEVDWIYEVSVSEQNESDFIVALYPKNEKESLRTIPVHGHMGSARIDGLTNGIDYELQIKALHKTTGQLLAASPIRLLRTGKVPGTVINYIHPDDYTYGFSGRSVASPSIVIAPDGGLIASHDIYWGKAGQNLSKIFRSGDNGVTWHFICDLYPCFWGKLFFHNGSLYMLATSTEYGALLIGRSDDLGETWTAPTVILAEGSRELGGPHRAPMPVTTHNGRLWTAVEYGSWQTGGHATGVVSAPEDADLLDPASWTATPFLAYDSNWPGAITGGEKPGLLEGNIIVTPEGHLVNLLRYQTRGGNPDYGRAIILNVDNRPEAPLTFGKVIDFHGNMSKFTIQYDQQSGRYWSLVSRVTLPNVSQRNILTLVSSADLEHWDIHRDILNYQDNGWPEDDKKVGFQYVDWQFQGEDILVASRTALNGAYNYHNANYMTFHRIEFFRDQVV
jgi:hypothetical protein